MVRTSTRHAGDHLGPYVLVRHLGTGRSAEVWEAVMHGPAGFRKPVALKVPHPTEAAEHVVREALVGARIQHPNVVATLQLSEHDGCWCLALELVRGASVDALARRARGRLPPSVVLDVGVQAAAALQHVHDHEAGLAHRGVTPRNLLVDASGLVKLADLGLGAGEFGAPEDRAGRPEARSDLFSLGAVLCAIASGEPPGSDPSLAEAAVPGLGAVLRACLQVDPDARPASAQAVGEALGALRARYPTGPSLADLVARSAPEFRPEPLTSGRPPPAGNLRPRGDAFVGRTAELAELGTRVREERWVALVGPGGIGKTRLAHELARRLAVELPGGAWSIDVAGPSSEATLGLAAARALGVGGPPAEAVARVGRALAAKGRAIVVLDGAEPSDVLAGTVAQWRTAAPEVSFVATARTDLPWGGTLAVGPMLPDDAVALLHARAPRALQESERAAAERLAHALGRLPFAIELAAARLRAVEVGDVLRDAPTLGAGGALLWSWQRLGPAARPALLHLSVFDRDFDLPAAEEVLELRALPETPWALDVLQELTEAGLLQVDPTGGRFWLAPSVRAFAVGLRASAAALAGAG